MSNDKITKKLNTYIQKSKSGNDLVVVIELIPYAMNVESVNLSRPEKIAIYQKEFKKELDQVTDIITREGGNVIGSAWINQTIKAKIPVKSIEALAQLIKVKAIDLPNQLQED